MRISASSSPARRSGTLVLGHGRAVSTLTTSMTTALSNRATIAGSEARLEFAGAFYTPTALTLVGSGHGQPSATWNDPTRISGMCALPAR